MITFNTGGTFRPQMPLHMVWLATNACNARCLHCSSNSARCSPDELTLQEVIGVIDQLSDAGVFDLAISGGEPLLRKDVFDVIHHARRRGMTVGLGSNGGFLSPSQANRLAESGINRFQVSLDGFAESHDRLRCWPGLFNRVLTTIKTSRDAGIRTHICCTINRLNAHQIELFTEFVSGLDVRRINFSRYIPTGRGTNDLDLSDPEWHAIIRLCTKLRKQYKGSLEIVGHLAQEILLDEELRTVPAFLGCQAGIGQGCITANGAVLPCVLLPITIGNVREKPFAQLWRESAIIRALQARCDLKGKCGVCTFRNQCGGCRAVAYAKTGDYLQSDQRCWLMTDAVSCV